jgi:hypothetical protein
MKQAAVGNLATFARSLEKGNIGLPLGEFKFLNFVSAELSRMNEHNASTSITGSGGVDRGTLGGITHSNKLVYDATTYRLAMDLIAMVGYKDWENPAQGVYTIAIRPDRDNEFRSLSFYLDEGGSYGPGMQFGRCCEDITLSEDANKRIEATVTYSEPTGDTISGAAIKKSGNTGTITANVIWSRGQRPNDADFSAGKSVYLKVDSATTGAVVLLAKVDTASGQTDGSNFPATAYGSTTFTVPVPSDSTDGWAGVVDSTSGIAMGLFGENNEPFEVTFGDSADQSALVAVGDEFEIPIAVARLTKVGSRENRLSAFHLIRAMNSTTDVRIDSGTIKITRPFKPYYANGRRLPYTIDPTGKLTLTTNFKKRLFDRSYRQIEGGDSRFTLYDVLKFGTPITGTYFEQVEIFQPQCMISALQSGNVAGFDALEETVTLEAEQPDDTADGKLSTAGITVPAGFNDTTKYPWQINITTPIDIAHFE